MDIQTVCTAMCETAREAGELIARTSAASVGVMQKSGTANYVTECDVNVQRLIFDRLGRFSPEIGLMGEEDGDGEGSDSDLVFIVDPIDGTSNFMFSMGLSAVSIALCQKSENRPLAAAVYCPYTAELFSATEGGGAFLNGRRISVSDNDLEHSLGAYGSTPYDRSVAGTHMAILSDFYTATMDVRNLGTAALHMAYLAAGRFGGFYELRLSPWDYAAGALLIAEAGGKLTNFCGERPSLTHPDSIVAGNAKCHGAVLDIIKKHLPRQ